MRTISLEEFERDFDAILACVEAGERFVIQQDGLDILRFEPARTSCPAT